MWQPRRLIFGRHRFFQIFRVLDWKNGNKMKISTQDATLIAQVETRIDRLTGLYGTVLRCIGALSGNTDSASRLVCEALQQVADELAEMIVHDTQ